MTRRDSTKHTFEHALRRLEEIVEQLEKGSVPLEDSIKMYEEGIALAKSCAEKLSQADLKLKRLRKDIDGHFQLLDDEEDEQ